MLACVEGADGQRYVELVGDSDDDGIDAAVRQHLVIVGVGDLRLVDRRHPAEQVLCRVADGVELGGPGFTAGHEVRGLGDLAAAEHADVEGRIFRSHGSASWV